MHFKINSFFRIRQRGIFSVNPTWQSFISRKTVRFYNN